MAPKQQKETKKKGGDGGGAGGSPKLKSVHVALSLQLSGRTPATGNIISLAMAAFTPDDGTIHSVFGRNLQPLDRSIVTHADVVGWWRNRPSEMEILMRDAVPCEQALRDLLAWCKPFGKVTLVANPLMSQQAFLAHAFAACCPDVSSMPWGFSAICVKSFVSGVLAVPVKDLGTDAVAKGFLCGMEVNNLPENDACVAAALYSSAWRHAVSQRQKAVPTAATAVEPSAETHQDPASAAEPPQASSVSWKCDKPKTLGKVPLLAEGILVDDVDLPFIEYPSITDTDMHGTAEFDKVIEDPSVKWFACEKVHGANFSMITNGKVIRAMKRSQLMKRAEAPSFFQFDRIVDQHASVVLELFGHIRENYVKEEEEERDRLASVQIFGEIAGGEYLHAMVPVDMRGRRVQRGVQYAPNNFFFAFDICLHFGSSHRFLDFTDTLKIFEACKSKGLLGCSPVPNGANLSSRSGLSSVSCEFQSLLPATMGLPSLPNNFAEGLVIRPSADRYVTVTMPQSGGKDANAEDTTDAAPKAASGPDGDAAAEAAAAKPKTKQLRVMIKRKHPMFREFAATSPETLNPKEMLFAMLTNARAAAVASKKGTAELARDVKAFAKAIQEDAEADALRLLNQRDPTNALSQLKEVTENKETAAALAQLTEALAKAQLD